MLIDYIKSEPYCFTGNQAKFINLITDNIDLDNESLKIVLKKYIKLYEKKALN